METEWKVNVLSALILVMTEDGIFEMWEVNPSHLRLTIFQL